MLAKSIHGKNNVRLEMALCFTAHPLEGKESASSAHVAEVELPVVDHCCCLVLFRR